MRENYLAKWLNDELSEEELKVFMETPEYGAYQKIVQAASRLHGPDFDVEEALSRVQEARRAGGGRVIRLSAYRKVLRIAAVIAVFLGITYYLVDSPLEQVDAGYAQQTEAILPDASEVVLNAGSELTYSKKTWDESRNVHLDGEAYFKVAKGQKFTVETSAGLVTVLGTQFNVLQRGDILMVSCYEGLVRVDYKDTSRELPAGSEFQAVNGQAEIVAIQSKGPSWMADESSFRSMPLSFVLKELERQYDITTETQGVDTSVLFTGTFSNTNLDLALQSISTPLRLGYSLDGDKVLIHAQKTP